LHLGIAAFAGWVGDVGAADVSASLFQGPTQMAFLKGRDHFELLLIQRP
jgi:hypothetical protein